jgi:TonB family protein
MNRSRFEHRPNGLRRAAVRLMRTAALALIAVLAIPAWTAGERPVKTRISPVYPEIARRLKITGNVRLAVTVDAEGKVTGVTTVSGNRFLSSAAEDAVRKWRFEPGSGAFTVEVSLNFSLSQ